MTDNVIATDLALRTFATIDGRQPLAAALTSLIELQSKDSMPTTLVVQDTDGGYLGMLSARTLARALVADWSADDDEDDDGVLEAQLLAAVRDRLDVPVSEVLILDLPRLDPAARLLEMARKSCERRTEFLPVIDSGRAVGVVPVTAIFQATASLVLKPEDVGIQFDQPDG